MRRAGLLLAVALCPWLPPGSYAAGTDFELKTPGVLRVLAQADGLPELYAMGKPAGLEWEMLQGFAALHDLKVETVAVPKMGERIPWLLEGKGDVLAGGIVTTESRKKQVDFASETFPIRHVVVTRRPHAVVATIEALRTQRVATVKGSSWAEEVAAAGVPKANVDDSFTSTEECVAALKKGVVSATVMSVIWAMAEKRRDPDLELGVMIGKSTSISFAVRKDQPRLLAALNEYVANTRRTPSWSRLVVKYFGEGALEVLKKSRE